MTGGAEGGNAALLGARVVLGVSGGIAAYKAVGLARLLVTAGADVDAVLTRGARRFVGEATFAGVTGNPAHTDVWEQPSRILHTDLARAADVVAVAPATAHLMARAAHGLADDLLTNVLLMATCPVVLAPAMHTEMWQHPATRANVARLRERGVHLIGPATGPLAGGDTGEGRMVEPDEIRDAVVASLRGRGGVDDDDVVGDGGLAGRRVVVTAGPTREHLDPVRFLSNRSSGRMGFALAAEAARRGAEVDLIAGPVSLDTPVGVRRHDVTSAHNMYVRVGELADGAAAVVKAAAVADFRPAQPSDRKIKKDAASTRIALAPNPDILAELGARRGDAEDGSLPLLVGFAAETDSPAHNGRAKLKAKRVDLMVVNDVSDKQAGFEVDTNRVLILGRDDHQVEVPLASKNEIAGRIWDEVAALLDT